MIALTVGEAAVLEHDPRACVVCLELEARERVDTVRPPGSTLRLDDADLRHQFDLPTGDHPAERRERAPGWSPMSAGAPPVTALNSVASMSARYTRAGGALKWRS